MQLEIPSTKWQSLCPGGRWINIKACWYVVNVYFNVYLLDYFSWVPHFLIKCHIAAHSEDSREVSLQNMWRHIQGYSFATRHVRVHVKVLLYIATWTLTNRNIDISKCHDNSLLNAGGVLRTPPLVAWQIWYYLIRNYVRKSLSATNDDYSNKSRFWRQSVTW